MTKISVIFDDKSPEFHRQPEHNELFLRQVRNHSASLLEIGDNLFVNEVLDLLGIPRIPAGCVEGWLHSGFIMDYVAIDDCRAFQITFETQGDIHLSI